MKVISYPPASDIDFTPDEEVCYSLGNLVAYIELLETGIRRICVPDIIRADTMIDALLETKRLVGIDHLRVKFEGSSHPRASGVILFKREHVSVAEELKALLELKTKTPEVHARIGTILGYSQSAIARFVEMTQDERHRQYWN